MDGFFLIDKPIGHTSHDVVYHIKKKFNLKKVGHTGTLDPFASGLLIICVGKATKLSDMFLNLDKSYTGQLMFNKHFDTYDHTGELLDQKDIHLSDEQVKTAIKNMIGPYDQEPPMYSAIKIDGKKLYEYARKGQTIDRPKRSIEIYDFKATSDLADDVIDFQIDVSKGTYIRSVAVDLAESLNTYGALRSLRRTTIGSYQINEAKTLEEITADDLLTFDDIFKGYPTVILDNYRIKLVKNGVMLDERQTTIDRDFIVLDENHEKIAYYIRTDKNKYKPFLIF